MKETPISQSTQAPASQATIKLTDIAIVVAGLGQTVLTDGTGSVTGKILSCTGTLEKDQSFDRQGFYDITATQANYTDAPFIGGSGTHKEPWRFGVNAHSA